MNLATALTAVFIFSGCAEMVTKVHSPVPGGTVRYSTGWFMAGKNRAKAIEEMNEYCQPGGATLLSENNQKEFTGQSTSNSTFNQSGMNTTTTHNAENYVYLHFRCTKKH